MALLKRWSDNFWSLVSPTRSSNNDLLPTPKTEPTFKKPLLPASQIRTKHTSYHTRSMSPAERVGSWRLASPALDKSSAITGRKRPRPTSPSSSYSGRRSKTPRIEDGENGSDDECQSLGDRLADAEDEMESPLAFRHYGTPGIRTFKRQRSRGSDIDESMSVNNTLIVSEPDVTPIKAKLVSLPEQHKIRGISTDELRAHGWDDDYITLIQAISMRGHEPLLPAYLKFEYKFLPDALFEPTDDAFVASLRNDHFKASKALEQLFELGGRVRDRVIMESRIEPEMQVQRQLESYLSWALYDADIDRTSHIPILAIEAKPAGTPALELRVNATRKCRRLASRYREALSVHRSVEVSPASRASDGTLLSYPLPTFYAIVASHAVVAIMAYKPDAPNAECTSVALFDFNDKDYDVWNSLALAILVCHVRNVQKRIAEETGLGARSSSYSYENMDVYEDDPDA